MRLSFVRSISLAIGQRNVSMVVGVLFRCCWCVVRLVVDVLFVWWMVYFSVGGWRVVWLVVGMLFVFSVFFCYFRVRPYSVY